MTEDGRKRESEISDIHFIGHSLNRTDGTWNGERMSSDE